MKLISLRQSGFTAVELVIAIVIATFVASLFFVQRNDAGARASDSITKTHINSLFYYLEDIYYPTKKAYPESLSAEQLKGLDPDSLLDAFGKQVNTEGSKVRYEGVNCNNGQCKGYKLSGELIKEGTYVKTNTH